MNMHAIIYLVHNYGWLLLNCEECYLHGPIYECHLTPPYMLHSSFVIVENHLELIAIIIVCMQICITYSQ